MHQRTNGMPSDILRLKQAGEGALRISRRTEPGQGPTHGGGRKIVCAQCRHTVTETSARTSVHGQYRHVFCNPGGFVFEIGCFSHAPGCADMGPKTTEFTWFPGYAWQVGVCRGCRAQLGWRYFARDGAGFVGLILDRIDEADED